MITMADFRTNNEAVKINGTITRKIGNRWYTGANRRPTGMYAEPGKIVTINFPEKIIGKARVLIGFDGVLGEYLQKTKKWMRSRIFNPIQSGLVGVTPLLISN